jgi:hypothetical protein
MAIVDSGNLWKNVLSLDFLHQLGLTRDDLREVTGIQEVGTAKSGTGLKVQGELKTPIHLRFGGCATRFKCRPVVLEGLSMPFNLSGPFLAQFEIDQLHSEGALLVQGKKIPMVAPLNPSDDVEQTVSNLYVMEKVTVPAFSKTKFAVRASAVEGGTMSPGDGIVTGSVLFSDRHDLHPFLNVVTKCDKDGQVRVEVSAHEPMRVPCTKEYPPKWKIEERWYCSYPVVQEFNNAPTQLNLTYDHIFRSMRAIFDGIKGGILHSSQVQGS